MSDSGDEGPLSKNLERSELIWLYCRPEIDCHSKFKAYGLHCFCILLGIYQLGFSSILPVLIM